MSYRPRIHNMMISSRYVWVVAHGLVTKPSPLRLDNEPGLHKFSASNLEKHREAWL